MIIERLHIEVKLRWNKLNSNHKQDLFPAELDDALNKAQEDLVEILYSGNNSKQYRFGFEVTQARIDMLSNLVKQVSITPTLVESNVYDILLPTDYKHFLSAAAKPCNSVLRIVRHNDLTTKLADENTKPSIKWNRILGVFQKSKIRTYTAAPITSLDLIYLKQPTKMFIGGYDTLEFQSGVSTAPSSVSPKQECELNETTQEMLIDMTVEYLARCFEDNNKIQIQKDLLLNK